MTADAGWWTTRRLRRIVLLLCFGPAVYLGVRGVTGDLGANPIAELMNQLGWWTLFLIVATLACTPLKILFGWKWPQRVRKTIGLAAFFHALAHFLVYFVLDQFFDLPAIWEDIVQRKFILVGFLAFVLLIPLAITSQASMMRRLGPARWTRRC